MAVDVPRSVVHVLDHGRAADRRVAVGSVGCRRVVLEDLFSVVREGPDGPERPRALRPKRHKPVAAVPSFRYGVPRVVSELSDSQELIYRYVCGPGKAGLSSVFGKQQSIRVSEFLTRPSRRVAA